MTDRQKIIRLRRALDQIKTMPDWKFAAKGDPRPFRGQTRADGYEQACREASRIAEAALDATD